MWIESPPAACWPLVMPDPDPDAPPPALEPNRTVIVSAFPLRPALVDECAAWCGGTRVVVNGGAALLLPRGGGVAGLGDYVVESAGRFAAEPAAGFDQRYVLVSP